MPDEPNQGLLDTQQAAPVISPVVEPVAAATTPPVDVFGDQLSMIKNEDGTTKYDSVPKAIEALSHSQTHIRTLESSQAQDKARIAELETQVAKTEAVEDVITRLTANPNSQVQDTPQPTGLDQAAVQDIVKAALNATKDDEAKQTNINSVTSTLTTKYGDKAREVIEAKVSELGMTLESVKALSATNPKAVLALFGETPTGATPTSSTITLPNLAPKPGELVAPKKSVLQGATSKEQAAVMTQIRESVYEKLGVIET